MSDVKTIPEYPRLKDISAIAVPMVLSQASETVNLFVDRLFLSRLGRLYISGAMSGGLTTFNIMSFFIGIIGYVNAVVAQNDGAGRRRACARATAQSIRLAFLAWPLLFLTIPLARMFFNGLGHLPEQVDLEITYFSILIYGSIFGLVRNALAGFFIGLGRTRIVMIANFLGMFINIPANWILIFGHLGIPPLGIAGAALGTLLGSFTTMFVLLLVYVSPKYQREFGTTEEIRFDRKLTRILLEYGTPAGVETFLNVAAFNLFVQLMHSYGPDTAAAVTIAFNYDMLAFIPMMGLGFAATTLAGRYVGAGNIPGAERAAILTLRTSWTFGSTLVFVFVFGARPLVSLFTSGMEGGEEIVAPMARTMLRLAAIYTLADATQLIFAGTLRGAGDTKFVMWMSATLHWMFAAVAWYSIKVAMVAPVVMWRIFIGFVLSLSIAMFLRYRFGGWRGMRLVETRGDSHLI